MPVALSDALLEQQLHAALRRRGIDGRHADPTEPGPSAVDDLNEAVLPVLLRAIDEQPELAPWIAAVCETWSRAADQRWRDTAGRTEIDGSTSPRRGWLPAR